MNANLKHLKKWLVEIAALLDESDEPNPQYYIPFLQEPDLALELINIIEALEDDEGGAYYSACIFAFEVCVAQLQTAKENGNRLANKVLDRVMAKMAAAISKEKHHLGFWLPILNAFYEVHIELSPDLKNAYLNLASTEEEPTFEEEIDHLNAMRNMIAELSDLSFFDIAENFFAQSYAMPADFFADLIIDLYSIEEGHDIALLTLLHPRQEVREIVVATFDQLIDKITLSPISLSRLQTIKNWYPPRYQSYFNRWLKIQRKKGVVFNLQNAFPVLTMKASEVDGSGAQGIFIHVKKGKEHKLCGLLFKQDIGIKDAWITPGISPNDIKNYYHEAFDDSITLRDINLEYFTLMTNHFLGLTHAKEEMPDLHLLEVQEMLGLHFQPALIDIPYTIEQLSVEITPFTPDAMQSALMRSKNWAQKKRFTESWYIENAHIDKLVNRCCTIIEGTKVCALEEAKQLVFAFEFEKERDKWLFHFLWMALWAKAKTRKNEKIWQDNFYIAYVIYTGLPLTAIPIMQDICHQTVINSIETMHERRTYLNQE